MPTFSQLVKSDPGYRDWYEHELNTASLVRQVIAGRQLNKLSGLEIWSLFTLCWWTRSGDHWKRIKIPALENLYKRPIKLNSALSSTLEAATHLPQGVAQLAKETTGFVNFRSVWRLSSQAWCKKHVVPLRNLLRRVAALTPSDDDQRIQIARSIEALPRIPSPTGSRKCRPELLLTPFVMCLDPQRRFPVLNGRDDVASLLGSMGLKDSALEKQVEGMLLLIGKFTISDAMMIDVLAGSEQLRQLAGHLATARNQVQRRKGEASKTPLRYHDDAEREATRKAASIVFRHLHNTMTKALGKGFAKLSISQGSVENCRYDALIDDYDGCRRNLLIEAKPEPDRGSIRIAIGQLFDYKRFLAKPGDADLAVLTIGRPAEEYLELLRSLQISSLWFTEDDCKKLAGDGPAWDSLKKHLPQNLL